MRQIDADALREVLETEIPISPITQRYNKEDVIRAIMDAPTIAHGTDSIMIKWTPDLDKLARDVAYRGLNEFSFMGKSIREWVEIILEQMARAAWVSVKDRLPEINGQFLCYSADYPFGAFISIQSYDVKKGAFWWHGDNVKAPFITHWMPLPEPPKEDENDRQNCPGRHPGACSGSAAGGPVNPVSE